jgi:hypothetical protein
MRASPRLGILFAVLITAALGLGALAIAGLSAVTATPALAQADPLTRFLDGIFRQQTQSPPQMMPRRASRPAPRTKRPRRAPAPAPVVVRDQAPEPKPPADTFIYVMGDAFADDLADGLEGAFAEVPTIEVSRKVSGNSGLVRDDYFDWLKTARERLASKDPVTVGVFIIGSNDRQLMRDGDTSADFGSDRWRELYMARIDAIEAAFAEKQVPLIWVGLPPMQSARYSGDMSSLNALFRERAAKADEPFVDIWEAFADDDNRFTAYGPDLNGRTVRLRSSNGIHFTKAGARKAAHFVELEIRRILEERNNATVLALPPSGEAGAKNDQGLLAALPAPPEPGALALPPPPVLAGPILPLTRRDMAAGGALAEHPPALSGYAGQLVQRVYDTGRAPDPRPGRADDFTWPRPQ